MNNGLKTTCSLLLIHILSPPCQKNEGGKMGPAKNTQAQQQKQMQTIVLRSKRC